MLKLIAQNKYKLMAFIIGLYLLVDVLQHKGQARVLFSKNFPSYSNDVGRPQSKGQLINQGKHWKKAVNTKAKMNELSETVNGFECDVYFDTIKAVFEIKHDADKGTGFTLNGLLDLYREKKLSAGIWLDIKNLDESNAKAALNTLIGLREYYSLQHKLLAESGRADLLSVFSDSGFFTSYYIPMFNPMRLNDAEIRSWNDSISRVLKRVRVNAMSGYYFQYPFLQHYFPEYPVLIWADTEHLSLVNYLFKRKVSRNNAIFIALYP